MDVLKVRRPKRTKTIFKPRFFRLSRICEKYKFSSGEWKKNVSFFIGKSFVIAILIV